jgi:hypothetical protein
MCCKNETLIGLLGVPDMRFLDVRSATQLTVVVVVLCGKRLDAFAVEEDVFVRHNYDEARFLPHLFLVTLPKVFVNGCMLCCLEVNENAW